MFQGWFLHTVTKTFISSTNRYDENINNLLLRQRLTLQSRENEKTKVLQ